MHSLLYWFHVDWRGQVWIGSEFHDKRSRTRPHPEAERDGQSTPRVGGQLVLMWPACTGADSLTTMLIPTVMHTAHWYMHRASRCRARPHEKNYRGLKSSSSDSVVARGSRPGRRPAHTYCELAHASLALGGMLDGRLKPRGHCAGLECSDSVRPSGSRADRGARGARRVASDSERALISHTSRPCDFAPRALRACGHTHSDPRTTLA